MQDLNKLKEIIEKSKELKDKADKEKIQKEKIIEVVDVTPVVKIEEPQNTLPATFISASTIRLSSKEATNSLTFHQRLSQSDERYDAIQVSEDKGKKILKGMVRLTAGSASVVPMKCKGSNCSMKDTCVTGDTLVLTPKGHVAIKDINVGDKVYSLGIKNKRFISDLVIDKSVTEDQQIFKIKTRYGNEIKLTSNHAVLTYNLSGDLTWKTLDEGLSVKDLLVVEDFDPKYADEINSEGDIYLDPITSITELGLEEVYDITVKRNSNFVANNIVVHNCPYFAEGAAPVNLPCLVERDLISYWMEKYIIEFNVEETSLIDMHMVSRLCEYDIYDMRLSRYLAEHDQMLLADFITSFDDEGKPITNKTVSAAFEIKERIDKNRSKTLKELQATREAKQKIITAEQQTTGVDFAGLKDMLTEINRKHKEKVVN